MHNDIFDIVLSRRKDIFDEVLSKRKNGDLLDRINKEIPSSVRQYVKSNKTIIPDIAKIVQSELSKVKVPPQKIVERIIKEIKVEGKKEEYNDRELRKEIKILKEEIDRMREVMTMIGGSGVLGLPSPIGHEGQFLTTDGNQFFWQTVTTVTPPSTGSFLLGEDGSYILLEDGTKVLLEGQSVPPSGSYALAEDGTSILLEDGTKLLLE
jgi:hypothetical protein